MLLRQKRIPLQRKRKQEFFHKGSYQSGQMGLTVTQLAFAFGGSNPSLPTNFKLRLPCRIAEQSEAIQQGKSSRIGERSESIQRVRNVHHAEIAQSIEH